jgi:L,D-transpeptidase catalytic domain
VGYTYALASQVDPETLTIWHDGRQVFRSLANTGIPAAPTANGTFPVYDKLPFQIMQGTNPGGSHYSDPVWYVSYFNGGDAVHYFPRPGYGYQQSLGCVELPWSSAAAAYPYLTYGSLVTVAG